MRLDIITIFPKIFDSYFSESIIKRALGKKLINIKIHNLRKFAADKHKKVDDKPYGGGAGMVLMAEPILRAVDNITQKSDKKTKLVLLSAKGKQFTQKIAYSWAKNYNRIILISGRYEGIDERVKITLKADEISIGPYITMDGDIAAMVIISALTRLIPNVINWNSLEDESFLQKTILNEAKTGVLEYPHFTRPEMLNYRGKKYRVPKILLSGNHKKIADWRSRKQKPIVS